MVVGCVVAREETQLATRSSCVAASRFWRHSAHTHTPYNAFVLFRVYVFLLAGKSFALHKLAERLHKNAIYHLLEKIKQIIFIFQICPTRVRVGAFSVVRFRQSMFGLFGVPLSTRRAEKKIKKSLDNVSTVAACQGEAARGQTERKEASGARSLARAEGAGQGPPERCL